jgi:hypothetical protein
MAAVMAQHTRKFPKLLQRIFCFMIFIRLTVGFTNAELLATFLSSIHNVICITHPDITLEILEVSFFGPNHWLHRQALLQLLKESAFSESTDFALPKQSHQMPDDLEFVENLIHFDKVFSLIFAYPLNDQIIGCATSGVAQRAMREAALHARGLSKARQL